MKRFFQVAFTLAPLFLTGCAGYMPKQPRHINAVDLPYQDVRSYLNERNRGLLIKRYEIEPWWQGRVLRSSNKHRLRYLDAAAQLCYARPEECEPLLKEMRDAALRYRTDELKAVGALRHDIFRRVCLLCAEASRYDDELKKKGSDLAELDKFFHAAEEKLRDLPCDGSIGDLSVTVKRRNNGSPEAYVSKRTLSEGERALSKTR